MTRYKLPLITVKSMHSIPQIKDKDYQIRFFFNIEKFESQNTEKDIPALTPPSKSKGLQWETEHSWR